MLSTLLTIWFLHVAAMLSPGPNMLLVSQLAASDHRRNAVLAAWGVATAAVVWVSCAVLGVNAVFLAFPGLRLMLQVVGGLYLLYVASRLWRSTRATAASVVTPVSGWAAYRLGFLTNITNPKSALFFGSVFAASFPAAPSHLLQGVTVLMIVLNALCWHILLAHLFSRERVRLAYARSRNVANRVSAVALGTFGLSLLAVSLREARARVS